MTSIPVPTFVPQDAWYSLTLGNLNPNIADSVPVAADLLPFMDSTNTLQDGIVGALDGAVIYLAGSTSKLDGGQGWLMWQSASLAISDGVNVFCPFVDSSKPGRWIATKTEGGGPGVIVTTINTPQGSTVSIPASPAKTIIVLVGIGSANPTNLTLPATTFDGQQIVVKDTVGAAGSFNIIVHATSVDGASTYTIQTDYGSADFVWGGTEWSAI